MVIHSGTLTAADRITFHSPQITCSTWIRDGEITGMYSTMAEFTWQNLHTSKILVQMAKLTKFRHIIIYITGAQYTNALQSGRMYHRADTNLTFSHKQTHYYIPEESFPPNSMPLTPLSQLLGHPLPCFPITSQRTHGG